MIGLSETITVKSKNQQKFTAKHQKGRRFPIKLQTKIAVELVRLQNEGNIENLTKCYDKNFISPIVIRATKGQ